MGGDNLSKPILYKANETDFTTLGLGVLIDELGTFAIEERNGQFYAEMEYPIDGKHFKELKNDRIIKADASNDLKDQRFKIIRIQKAAKGIAKIEAEHVSNLTADKQLAPNVGYRGDAQTAGNIWLNNITDEHPFTFYSDITTNGGGHWEVDEVENARQALGGVQGSLLDTYGGEYRFDNYRISLLKQRGNDNGIPIMYGKNLVDLEQEEEIANTYTSVMPYAIHQPEGADEPIIITLPEYFVDSEHVDKYARRKILKVNFTTDEIETVSELRERTKRYIRENDVGVPKVNLRVNFVDLAKTLDYKEMALIEEINLCDWVVVYFEKLGIKTRAKVIKTKWNSTLERYEEIEIGEARASLTQSLNSVVDGRMNKVEKQVNEVRASANGKNANHYGYAEPLPQDSKENDTWFRPIADGDTEMYRYNGYQWEYVLSTADTTENARKLEELYPIIEEAKEQADHAVNEIEIAVENAGFTSLDETISSVQSISNAAQANADVARDHALDALSGANTAMTDARSALNGIDQLESTVADINIDIDEINGTLSLKADSDTVNVLDGTVSSLSTEVGVIAGELSAKADSSLVDTISGIVDNHTLDIQANAEGLAVKADSSRVDTLEGTVSSLGAEFDIVAGQVSSKVWNTDIESAIDGIEVGGRNLIIESDALDNSYINSSAGEIVYSAVAKVTKEIEVEPNEEFVYSKEQPIGFSAFRWLDSEKNIISNHENAPAALEIVLVAPPSAKYLQVSFRPNQHWKLERGNVKTDWTPAPEDTDAKITHIETEWTQTFDTFSQTVAGIDGRVTSQKQTIDSITSMVADAEGRISMSEQNIHGLQDTVSDPVNGLVTQVSTLASGFNVITEDISNIPVWKRVLPRASQNKPVELTYPDSKSLSNNSSYDIYLSAETGTGANNYSIYTYNNGNLKLVDRRGSPTDARLFLDGNKVMVETHFSNVTQSYPYTATVTEQSSKGGKSSLSVLNDNINLRVQKNDVINQINISTEGILLDAAKVHIGSSTTIDDGILTNRMIAANAQIDGAKIGNATISSAKIIDLDVNKISGLTSNFVQSYWNSATGGSVRATGDGILTTASNGAQGLVQNGVFLTRDPSGSALGYIGYGQPGSDNRPFYTINLSQGAHFRTRHHLGSENYRHGLLINAGAEYAEFNVNRVHYKNQISLRHSRHFIEPTTYDKLTINGSSSVTLGASLQTVFVISASNGTGYSSLYANLDMKGYHIKNAGSYGTRSERKYKSNIIPIDNAIETVEQMNFYSYIKDGENELGIIADEAPESVLDTDRKTVNIYSYASLIGKSNQELIQRVKELESEVAVLKGMIA